MSPLMNHYNEIDNFQFQEINDEFFTIVLLFDSRPNKRALIFNILNQSWFCFDFN